MSRVWFITGSSRGFGREWAIAALRRGERVAATARDASSLDDLATEFGDNLLALTLDVTDRDAAFATVAQAHAHFGALDVVVNNAGYGHFGMIEEVTEQEAREQIETNVFGALWVTQAALPFLREQRSGHLIQVSSVGGVTAMTSLGIYNASKWALEGLSEALAKEMAAFGVHVTIVEPGPFGTDWAGDSARRSATLEPYVPVYEELHRGWAEMGDVRGDPAATSEAILRVVEADEPPLRLLLGTIALGMVEPEHEQRLATWREWQPVAELAQGAPSAG